MVQDSTNDPNPSQFYNAYGHPWAADQMRVEQSSVLSNSSFGDRAGQLKYILQTEYLQLKDDVSKNEFIPKTGKAQQDSACMQAAENALTAMKQRMNEIPKPTWMNSTGEFKAAAMSYFSAAAKESDIPQSAMNSAVNRYNLSPAEPTVNAVEAKIKEVSHEMNQLAKLEKEVDRDFNEILTHPKFQKEKEMLAKMGINSIDGIYALNPGLYREKFMPKDGDGKPMEFDPKNMVHCLHAIHHFLKHPDEAQKDGIRLYGAKGAMTQLPADISAQAPASTLTSSLSHAHTQTIAQMPKPAPAPVPTMGMTPAPAASIT